MGGSGNCDGLYSCKEDSRIKMTCPIFLEGMPRQYKTGSGACIFGVIKMASHDLNMVNDYQAFASKKKRLFDADGVFVGRLRTPRLKIVKLEIDAMVPDADSDGCWDIRSGPGPTTYFIPAGERKIIGTKICMIIPDGFVGWCRPFNVWGEDVVSMDRLIRAQDACVEVLVEVANYGELGFFVRPFTKLCEVWLIPCPGMRCVIVECDAE